MCPQRMRYQWFQDVPRNVTRREYQRYQFRQFTSLGLGAVAGMMAFLAATGLTLQSSRELAEVPSMSVADAAAHQGDRLDWVKLEGYLVADDALTMPDDPARQVIRGRIVIEARSETDEGENGDEALRVVLYDWEAAATTVALSDGDRHLPLAFDLAVLPMQNELGEIYPEIVRAGESARTRRPVAIDYGEQRFPLPLEQWGQIDSVLTDFDRQVLPQGQSVVVVAALEPTAQGNQLVDPLGDRLQVLMGTEKSIREQGQHMRMLFAILCVPIGFASWWVGRSAAQLHREFVERSNG